MSGQRDDSVYVAHIREAAERIGEYLRGLTEIQFYDTPLVQDAVIRQIQIIGEAARRLSPDFRASTPDVPWADIAGMHNKLVHDYMGVDLEAVWDTAVTDIPVLLERLSGEAASG